MKGTNVMGTKIQVERIFIWLRVKFWKRNLMSIAAMVLFSVQCSVRWEKICLKYYLSKQNVQTWSIKQVSSLITKMVKNVPHKKRCKNLVSFLGNPYIFWSCCDAVTPYLLIFLTIYKRQDLFKVIWMF